MLEKITQFWFNYKFEIILVSCIVFIGIFSLIRLCSGKKGNWTRLTSNDINHRNYKTKTRKPPQESKGEIECRRVLENIFKKPFKKTRPNFLNNPVTGGEYNLEIDCFNQELKLGCEYSGIQHYKYVPYFHKNKEAFYNQKYRDEMKKTKCKQNGIMLIEVPYTVKLENIERYILNELKRIYKID